MKLTIQTPNFKMKPELNNFITEKVNKLTHFHDRIEAADVCLKLEKSGQDDNKVCEIRLSVPGKDLFAKRQSNTFEEAADKVLDALQQQIKKIKD